MENSENKNEALTISAENWTPIVKRRRTKPAVQQAEVEKTEAPAPEKELAAPEKPAAEDKKPAKKAEPTPEKKETHIEKAEEPKVEVIPEESIEPVKVKEEEAVPIVKPLTKKERKALLDKKEEKRDRNDDGSIFTTKAWRALWDKICFVLLVAAIGIPTAILVYIIAFFFI